MYIFSEQEIRQCVTLDQEVIAVIERAFTDLATDKVTTPPIMRIDVPEHNGEVDVKTAYVKGDTHFAIKVSSGFFDNHLRGLPSGCGLMILMDAKTGVPAAALLDNGYLTNVRTAAAGAVAAKHLSNAHLTTVGVVGSGVQARQQVLALAQVRNFSRLLVYGRNRDRISRFEDEMARELNIPVRAVDNAERLVQESDLLITATPSRHPVISADWLHPGLHITAMGSDAEDKQELEAVVMAKADLAVCDLKVQSARLGELHHALVQGLVSEQDVVELGEITSGKRRGRTSDEQITVCDLTGTGVQDTAIAQLAFTRLLQQGLGFRFDNSRA